MLHTRTNLFGQRNASLSISLSFFLSLFPSFTHTTSDTHRSTQVQHRWRTFPEDARRLVARREQRRGRRRRWRRGSCDRLIQHNKTFATHTHTHTTHTHTPHTHTHTHTHTHQMKEGVVSSMQTHLIHFCYVAHHFITETTNTKQRAQASTNSDDTDTTRPLRVKQEVKPTPRIYIYVSIWIDR